ncbi:MAG TPA: LAGLIDADG family homing endonuclease, partial [Tissierellaceae bacterium]|nr:LAGLIDADG family homing endonuclease [Tissierellaceae bacterium]
MDILEIEKYTKEVLPNLRKKLLREKDKDKLVELYNLYEDVLCLIAPYDFDSFNEYLEFEEDKSEDNRGFHHHRKKHMFEVHDTLNQMEVYDKYDIVLISLPPRTGKALRNSELVLTSNGWVEMGDIKVGDIVYGKDGKETKVTGVFPQGLRDIYRVTFDDKTTVDCDLEHLWEVRTRDDRSRDKDRVVTTADMLDNLYVEGGTRKNYSINYVNPIEFGNKLNDDDLHPYLLGSLIGDGGLTDRLLYFHNNDDEIVNRLSELLPETDKIYSSGLNRYTISKKDTYIRIDGKTIKCTTSAKLEEYGLLDKLSYEMFLPSKYLYSTIDSRLELLRGLMDTDGYTESGNSSSNEFTTVSRQLAVDVVELLRSLGARVTLSTKQGSYKKNGLVHKTRLVYRIHFNMELNPFYTSRKYDKFKPRVTRKYKYIESIEKIGQDLCTCISIDSPDKLFITNGYNLTHNTTYSIRFLAWIIGKYPEHTQLGTSYSDNITSSFYNGLMEIVMSDRYKQIFPSSNLVNQNAKRQEIWLRVRRRYPSIAFVPVGGSVTGRSEAEHYLYVDDLVSGQEEALSPVRLEKLWEIFSTNFYQRKKQNAKMLVIGTRWSIFDPMTKLEQIYEGGDRFKSLKIPALDENGNSNFKFQGGFDESYYAEMRMVMDEITFNSLYQQEPIEREGLLYHSEDLQYYFDLPEERPDTVISVADTKGVGKDYVASPIGYMYGDLVYIEDVVYNSG